ncbi:MAG: hypothetical protein JW891_00805 [Candidatus Lokiarchaeota archaeon]|nr:hypothetical protein [Candidatus Lokiarchaeota archaeon]
MLVKNMNLEDLKQKHLIIQKIQNQLEQFTPLQLKKVIFDLIKNDDLETLRIYYKQLETI